MKKWDIPVSWREFGTVRVEADTLEEAIEIAKDKEYELPFPENSDSIEGTWRVEYDIDTIRSYFNLGQV